MIRPTTLRHAREARRIDHRGRRARSRTGVGLLGAVLTLGAGCGTGDGPAGDTAPLLVQTEAGLVRGAAHDGYHSFEGVPYAAPPVGDLRWAPPEPPVPWDGERDATRPGSPCPQLPSHAGEGSTEEDCLVLNVTAPDAATPDEELPVMLWIHGDGAIGSGDVFDPSALATQGDVVVVTINYRLGVFGAFDHATLDDGPVGLLDQRRAMHWVRDNIDGFGGDPDNLTIFGESYGGNSVAAHLMSPGSEGAFDAAIMQSGFPLMDAPAESTFPGVPALDWFGWSAPGRTDGLGAQLAASLGCTDEATAVECLRDVPAERILAEENVMQTFQPYPLGNEALPADPRLALRDGEIADVPVLTGTTRDEHRFFVGIFRDGAGMPVTAEHYPQLLGAAFGEDAPAVLAEYPLSDYDTPSLAFAAVFEDRMWGLGQREAVELLAAHTDVYSYEFADRSAPAGGVFPPGFDGGAFHSAELSYVFPTAEVLGEMTPEQEQLSADMIAYWTAFAHEGEPDADRAPEWDEWEDDEPNTQWLAPDGIDQVDRAEVHNLAFWRDLTGR